ncbi:MAG: choice-of-anchor B family protein [Bacteroidia bacterium]|nr:choice-of-anchor B family protein [Bacteroidia bacterium]
MKKISVFILTLLTVVVTNGQNLQFRSKLTYNGVLANIGGIAVNGHEYALVGWEEGLSIVDVTNPDSIFERYQVPGPTSNWREVKTFGNYAYVTTEGSGGPYEGLTIINLSDLPATINNTYHKTYKGDGAILNQIQTIHALHIDSGYLYLYGSNLFSGTAVICNLNNDPWNPQYVGNSSNADPNYIHDGYVRNNVMYGCHIYDGYFSIIDVSNKANPVLLNTQTTPDNFSHNSWLNDAGNVLFTTDEVDDSYLAAYDISDPFNIQLLDKYQTAPGSQAVVHNTHTLNDYQVVSWYKEGVVIVDAVRPDNLIEVGHYDTSPQTGGGFDGAWGVYPYLPSGNVLVSDMSEGLFVLTPTYQRACYLEGLVSDSITLQPINGVAVNILTRVHIENTNFTGMYKTGTATAGLYDIVFTKQGYISKIVTGVSLSNGVVTNLNVLLQPLTTVGITGSVTDVVAGINNATVFMTGINGNYTLAADANGNFTANVYPGSYDITVGKWGYVTQCFGGINITPGSTLNYQLTKGYYDDFSLDFNWNTSATANTGVWVREVPVGTTLNNNIANPNADVITDCNAQAFVTGNAGGGSGNDDIDGGAVVLTSPVFDLTTYASPVLSYARWFFNAQSGGNAPNDSLTIYISNGLQTVVVEAVGNSLVNNSKWLNKTYNLNSLITPTANMTLIVKAEDISPGNVTEAGFDVFQITDGIAAIDEQILPVSAMPNPFNDATKIIMPVAGLLTVTNVTGQVVYKDVLEADKPVYIGKNWQAGVYFLKFVSGNNVFSGKLIKQ